MKQENKLLLSNIIFIIGVIILIIGTVILFIPQKYIGCYVTGEPYKNLNGVLFQEIKYTNITNSSVDIFIEKINKGGMVFIETKTCFKNESYLNKYVEDRKKIIDLKEFKAQLN